ncbi:hypothetical protein N5T77_09015, partial [Aliarcobacter cryaerophilus]|uniref:immunoglobulin-like domain-containing protein n=1 Tax=Aliarcobacter cryaerophilus TaxID=28198 RepID=UPI0021B6AD14
GATATAKVTDIGAIDTTTVTLTGSVDNDQITITASVDNAPQTNLTITLSNGETILIEAGETEGSTTFTTPVQTGGTFDYTISITTGGNYEDLDTTSTKVTVIVPDLVPPVISIEGSEVREITDGTATNSKVVGQVTITLDKAQDTDLTVTLSNGQEVVIPKDTTSITVDVETSRVDDAYKQDTTYENVSISSTSNPEIVVTNEDGSNKTATITIKDDIDPIDVTVTATVTTPKIIDVTTATDGTTGVKITAIGNDGKKKDLSVISGTDHDGFGVETVKRNGDSIENSNGDTKELGVGEKIVVEFTDGKDVNSLDVSFAWRNNHETAKLTFIKDGQVVGYATVTGDGSSTTKAIVNYYDENNNLIKTVNAKGSSDKVDEAFTFELPDSNGGIVSFDKVEFSAPTNVDDYLINKIVYKEVLDPTVTDIVTNGGNVTFNIQIDENYPPQGSAKAIVSVNGTDYEVALNATGRGTLTIDSKDLGDLSNVNVVVKEIIGGNYEKVNTADEEFDFTPIVNIPTSSDDVISTDEDTSYILNVTDFGDVSVNTQEFKITELPTNGKLILTITTGDTIFNQDGTQSVATENKEIEITKDQIISLAQVGAGKVEFVPNENTDDDGSFKFQVGDGNGNFSQEYTTTIDVKAIADAPTVSIDVTKVGETTIVVDGNSGSSNSNGNSGNDNSNGGIATQDFWKGYNSKEDIMTNSTHNENSIRWDNPFTSSSDNVDINGNQNGWISTEGGNDNVYISGNAGGMNTGSGDDRVFIQGNSTQEINLDIGNDELHIKGNSSTITAGAGDDKILIEGEATNNINLGAGNDSLEIKGNASTITAGAGDDKIKIYGNANNTIELGNGNNYVEIKGDANSIQVSGDSGNDRVIVNGNAKNNIDLGAGDDYLELGGKIINYVDGGAGDNDSVYLKGYTLAEYQALIAGGNEWRVRNFENIKLGDGTIVKGDGSVFETPKTETTIKAVEYKVDISAALKDIDGSETLSVVIKNVPDGAKLYDSNGVEISATNGEYKVTVPEGSTSIVNTLTMKVPQSYKGEINLQIEAKATETRDNEDGTNFKIATDSDAVVVTVDETSNITVDKGTKTNLVLTLDVSGSMVKSQYGGVIDSNGTTRFDVLKQSMISIIETYNAAGETKVNMTLFSSGVKNLGWMSAKDALSYLDTLTIKNDKVYANNVYINLESKNTDYYDAITSTQTGFNKKGSITGAENKAYFISDGEPNDNKDKIDKDSDSAIKQWKTFITNQEIDLKVIGVGTPEGNAAALNYLKVIQVMPHDEVIIINEPTSIETIILGTVEGTVFGDVSDNFTGGDGRVTIDSIEVDGKIYTKDGSNDTTKMPNGGLQIGKEGKLLFDFETGKYAYNGNGADITEDKTKSFKVNVSDENGDENSFNVNFELNKEQNDGVFSFKEGGDINFSNLENIVNLKEINLDNGKENKLSLTLDDVLKLSGDDGKIKITGDQFDSVAFKNEDGKAWKQETSITENNKTFDVYSGSIGDQTVQVKVEQPISDGITN